MPSLGEFLFGKKEKFSKKTTMTPEQSVALQRFFSRGIEQTPLFGQGQSFLQQLLSGSPEAFSQFEAPLRQQFEQQTVPMLAERFAGMGTGAGGLNSSALAQALAQAGRGLTTDIGALRGGLQMQALPQALGFAQQPYQNILNALGIRAFDTAHRPTSFGALGGALLGFGKGLGESMGQSFGKGISGGNAIPGLGG